MCVPKDPASCKTDLVALCLTIWPRRPRASAFPLDTFSLVVSDLKGQFLPSVKEQLFGMFSGFVLRLCETP